MSATSGSLVVHAVFDRAVYVVVASRRALASAALAAVMVPVTIPGGNPVMDTPGLRPRFPDMIVLPVFVTVEAPRTTKPFDVPRGGSGAFATSTVNVADALD